MTFTLTAPRLIVISLLLLALVVTAACGSDRPAAQSDLDRGSQIPRALENPTPSVGPPTATPTPRPTGSGPASLATVTPAPFPAFAPDDPRRHLPLFLDDTPEYDKLELGNNVVVWYPMCNPNSIIDRWAHTVIYYTEDGSRAANWTIADTFPVGEDNATNNSDRYFDFNHTVYHSEEGRAALDVVLSDPELVIQLLEYAAIPARCPAEFVDVHREQFDSVPNYDKFVIDDDTVAFFESCDTEHDERVAPIVISHFPTESSIAVIPGEPGFRWPGIGTPSGHELLAAIVEDQSLMSQLAALAPREARCG